MPTTASRLPQAACRSAEPQPPPRGAPQGREERLLLLTLKEIGLQSSYCDGCFDADTATLTHLQQLGWPLGRLHSLRVSKTTRKRFQRG